MNCKPYIKDIIKKNLSTHSLKPDGNNKILFTFDDGPMTETTSQVLEILLKYDIKAIFFVVGKRIENRHEILKSIVEAGHELGNHSYFHHNDAEPSFIDYFNDVRKCQQIIQSITGKAPRFFRPPRGILSIKSLIIPRLLGLQTIMWSLDVEDWRCRNIDDGKLAANRIINEVSNTDIVLLHDDNRFTPDILSSVLPVITKTFKLASPNDLL